MTSKTTKQVFSRGPRPRCAAGSGSRRRACLALGGDTFNGAWGRVIGHHGHREGDPIGIYGIGGPEFDYSFGALQMGLDAYGNENEDGTIDRAGAPTASMRERLAPTGHASGKTTPISTA